MNHLTIFVFVLSIVTFAAMMRGIWLHSKIRAIRNYNDDGINDLRIERVKKKARFAHVVAGILCSTSAAACYAIGSGKLSVMFAAFGLISALSYFSHRADRRKLAAAVREERNEKKFAAPPIEKSPFRNDANDLFNIADMTFAGRRQTDDDAPPDEDQLFAEALESHRQMQIEHEREKRRREEDDDRILDSDLLH